ncbi:tRNA (N6-threonylcarbamoyladenosine(37)-N6)-methyltransferase TrmO [Oceanobacter sp. 3_MG-2023]|jgi:tRNA-Thr(GGU) m(6)t(6)A37 methyltransferase TsaA|uniref:tRNA (N6-threonylcarbamoyladenosine(37)-N6)-methyltransferase TrmO n=1 Tax=Oceanobacter sp. 3_MG-2023 TaxID=3062622 RepID=UPI0027373D50|nr:tRNA (N6-threonylcarbamoyladenosine(37)-N6)-methyltransferase TrmO [Oceanobacter sp. 3_MG-2023]MDP2506823.1 tRNA (N6-threonylcarbamoyladenosine(37)-N6)-methyltransferase TrmO [Oceanobacter sp. 3_MG-2023]
MTITATQQATRYTDILLRKGPLQPRHHSTMYSLSPVAIAHTPFREKFAIPRQPMLAPAARGEITLLPPFDDPLAFDGLEQVSHVWLIFLFHQAMAAPGSTPRMRVRPPRLGGNSKLGVFATRSSHRPNAIGQSLVKIEQINATTLTVSGVDLLDQTPIIDIKPYVPYADHIDQAWNHIAADAPEPIQVHWDTDALATAQQLQQHSGNPLVDLIEQCLSQDPKPAYQQPAPERQYGTRLWDIEVGWYYPTSGCICINRIQPVIKLNTPAGK